MAPITLPYDRRAIEGYEVALRRHIKRPRAGTARGTDGPAGAGGRAPEAG